MNLRTRQDRARIEKLEEELTMLRRHLDTVRADNARLKGEGLKFSDRDPGALRCRLKEMEDDRDRWKELAYGWKAEIQGGTKALFKASQAMIELREQRDALAAHVERLDTPATAFIENVDEVIDMLRSLGSAENIARLCHDLSAAGDQLAEALDSTATASLARRDAELLNKPFEGLPGCTDGGCVVKKPVGMHTNGGCQCIKYQTASTIVQRLAHLRDQFRQQAEETQHGH